ncbi:secreted aspartic proteinase precursor [Purpureocillium lilacinum]|uniref:Secreted aspartic proteinase n=1 Tax=Purpureocillium lilacinum TaxID=33203 RepID=A0A2U3ECS1_PURLI|nr:secreted aspartic proteinase precursor [Purpureocillium lilacinum]
MKIRSTLLAILGAGGGKAGAFPLGSSGDFSIVTSRNPDHQPSGPLALARAYLKYGQPLTDPLAAAIKALDKRWTGSVVATPVLYDVEYIVEAHLGTPAQKVMMNIDTGSSDFWVYSSETPPEILNGQSIYRPEKSRSAKRLDGATWSIRYGDGSWSSGNVWIDNVSLGGLRIKGQALETATNASKSLTTDAAMSGILGLGFSKGNTVKPDPQLTFMDTARPHMRAPLFTANLNYHANGTYKFGKIDKSEHKGPITYTPVLDPNGAYWTFATSGYAVGGGEFNKTTTNCIADTGTSLLLLPPDLLHAYYDQVPGAEWLWGPWGYVYTCDQKLPDFTFGIEGAKITIPGKYLTYADWNGTHCYGGIQHSFSRQAIFGDVAFTAALVVFDLGNLQTGWAQK